jgi:DNA-binding NarL/FixJ family response regulator
MPCRILICEENKFFRQSLLDILLSRFSDIVIKVGEDTGECLRELQECSPHILFMDLYRKGQEGLGMIRCVREKHPAAIIIAFTEYDLDEYRAAALFAGVNHVIPKELWTGGEILALVETLLKNRGLISADTTKGQIMEDDFWARPLERRKKKISLKDQVIEKEYLAHNEERREFS